MPPHRTASDGALEAHRTAHGLAVDEKTARLLELLHLVGDHAGGGGHRRPPSRAARLAAVAKRSKGTQAPDEDDAVDKQRLHQRRKTQWNVDFLVAEPEKTKQQ